jgi:UDP-2,3-diacylglucosamine hydrolase
MSFHFETRTIQLQEGRCIYFSSDQHFGVPSVEDSRKREQYVISWLNAIEKDAQVIFLVGDIFDFWFEYKQVVPKGFVRILGKLAELADKGIELILFTGNHDMWMFGYLTEELGAQLYRNPVRFNIQQKNGQTTSFLVGHGDGLGPGDETYKMLKKIFSNRFFQALFRIVHPDIGMWIGLEWSRRSRAKNAKKGEEYFKGEAYEWLFVYCQSVENVQHHDYYIFGHRHLPLDLKVSPNSRYINLGEWVYQHTYGVYDGNNMALKRYQDDQFKPSNMN